MIISSVLVLSSTSTGSGGSDQGVWREKSFWNEIFPLIIVFLSFGFSFLDNFFMSFTFSSHISVCILVNNLHPQISLLFCRRSFRLFQSLSTSCEFFSSTFFSPHLSNHFFPEHLFPWCLTLCIRHCYCTVMCLIFWGIFSQRLQEFALNGCFSTLVSSHKDPSTSSPPPPR